MSNPHLSPPLGVGIGGDLTSLIPYSTHNNISLYLRFYNLTSKAPPFGRIYSSIAPASPTPNPHWEGWGITLIAALLWLGARGWPIGLGVRQ